MKSLIRHSVWLGLFVCQTASAQATVTATATGTPLDLDGEGGNPGTHIVKVADVTFSTTNSAGCTLTVSSGELTKSGGLSIAYNVVTVADSAAAPTSGDFTVPSGSDLTYSIASATSSDRDLYVKYTTRTLQDPGTYNETITLSVADN